MKKKRTFGLVLIFLLLAVLVYLQVRTWKRFDWATFSQQTAAVNWWLVLAAVGLIYLTDALRAVRWAIFLKPVKKVDSSRLVAPQFVGFTGLALLGRPGELIRPYIIARKVELSFSSQLAVWLVERLFDSSAVALLLSLVLLFSKSLQGLSAYSALRQGGLLLIAVVTVGIGIALLIRRFSESIANRLQSALHGHFPHVAHNVRQKLLAFGEGLNTIHDLGSFAAVSAISIGMWSLAGAAYYLVTHAYAVPELRALDFGHSVLLMSASVAGGVLQLPMVGGGSQLATITMLLNVFHIGQDSPELATSCGILLWAVTFMAVVPVGLALAHREHLSLRKLEDESQPVEEEA
jgi:uncharacterized protein (TIRG00374 family)